jgi:heme exporter protein B
MKATAQQARTFCWLVQKDLLREIRAPLMWPSMGLVGLVLVMLLTMQTTVAVDDRLQVVAGFLWLVVFFAGTIALERSFCGERDDGCWQALLMYPTSPGVIYLAKMAVNLVSLVLLECLLVPAFIVLWDVPLLMRPGCLVLVLALANVGFAAAGTLISALTSGLSQRGGLMVLLLLPVVVPVILGAAEATRLLLAGHTDEQWWRWVQLLTVFAVFYTTLGTLVFEFVIED